MRIPSGVTDQFIYFVAVDATDLKTRETGLSSFTVYRSRNGGAAAAYTTPTINETDSANMPGVYELLLDEDMTIDSGNDSEEVCLHITHTGMAPVTRVFELYRTIDGNVANKIADHVLRRSLASARASSDGDAVSFRSLFGAISKLVNRIDTTTTAGRLSIFEEDDASVFAEQALTTDATADPITEADTV